jgi:acyl-CoA thioester hydrolase
MPVHRFVPPTHAYHYRFRVERADIDELGHANNVVWVRWLNQAAIAHATHVGWGMERCRAEEVIWVVRRHDIEYLLPAFEGEELSALTWVEGMRGASSQRRSVFLRRDQVLASAETTWVLIEAQGGKPRRVPAAMLAAYGC